MSVLLTHEIAASVATLELVVPVTLSDLEAAVLPASLPPPATDFSPSSIWVDAFPIGIYDDELAALSGFSRGEPTQVLAPESDSGERQTRGTADHYMSHCEMGGYCRQDDDIPMFLPGRSIFGERLCSVTRADGEDPATHFLLAGAWMVSDTVTVRVLAAEEHLVAFHRPGSSNGSVMQMPGHRFANYAAQNNFRIFLFMDGVMWEAKRTFVEPDYYRQHLESLAESEAESD